MNKFSRTPNFSTSELSRFYRNYFWICKKPNFSRFLSIPILKPPVVETRKKPVTTGESVPTATFYSDLMSTLLVTALDSFQLLWPSLVQITLAAAKYAPVGANHDMLSSSMSLYFFRPLLSTSKQFLNGRPVFDLCSGKKETTQVF